MVTTPTTIIVIPKTAVTEANKAKTLVWGIDRPSRKATSVDRHLNQAHKPSPAPKKLNSDEKKMAKISNSIRLDKSEETTTAASIKPIEVRIQAKNVRSFARVKRGSGSVPTFLIWLT
jgi:hypothetical protein